MRKIIAAVLAALAVGVAAGRFGRATAGPQSAAAKDTSTKEAPLHRGGYLNAYIALLRSDLRARKAGYINEGLRLKDKEAAVFRPIHQSYEADLKKIDDARVELFKEYAEHYDKLTDAKAEELAEKRLALEVRRANLWKSYLKRLNKVLPAKTVTKFFQLEYRFALMLDLKNSSEVPLIE